MVDLLVVLVILISCASEIFIVAATAGARLLCTWLRIEGEGNELVDWSGGVDDGVV